MLVLVLTRKERPIIGKFLMANEKRKGEEVVEQVSHAVTFCVNATHLGRAIFTWQMHEVMVATKSVFDHKNTPQPQVKQAWSFVKTCLAERKGCPI